MSRETHPEYSGSSPVGIGLKGVKGLSAKATLAVKLNALLDDRGFSQTEAAEVLGIPQPKISAIRHYKLQGISLERLMQALTALGQHVEIVVRPSRHQTPARIRVAA